ncbi:MAG: hypothetical protein ABI699_03910 [Caldimonas sp.]
MKTRSPRSSADEIVVKLTETLQDAVKLLQDAAYTPTAPRVDEAEQATLLEQCLLLCEQQAATRPEPVRTLHHFACTGGTLISKCIAALPNVQLLSEVDPLSPIGVNPDKPRFAPTDMGAQMRQSTRGTSQDLLIRMFQGDLRLVFDEAVRNGQRLVIRDHAHSHYCIGDDVPDRPTLRELLPADLPLRSVVTVRHPLDSYASLVELRWAHFLPSTIDEYCARYLRFLKAYEGLTVIRYEDFVRTPRDVMRQLGQILDIPYAEDFAELRDAFKISGDSGRTGLAIEPRKRRAVALSLMAEAGRSENYHRLTSRLGYEPGGAEAAS